MPASQPTRRDPSPSRPRSGGDLRVVDAARASRRTRPLPGPTLLAACIDTATGPGADGTATSIQSRTAVEAWAIPRLGLDRWDLVLINRGEDDLLAVRIAASVPSVPASTRSPLVVRRLGPGRAKVFLVPQAWQGHPVRLDWSTPPGCGRASFLLPR